MTECAFIITLRTVGLDIRKSKTSSEKMDKGRDRINRKSRTIHFSQRKYSDNECN